MDYFVNIDLPSMQKNLTFISHPIGLFYINYLGKIEQVGLDGYMISLSGSKTRWHTPKYSGGVISKNSHEFIVEWIAK